MTTGERTKEFAETLKRIKKIAKDGVECAGECEDAMSLFESYRDDMKATLAEIEQAGV